MAVLAPARSKRPQPPQRQISNSPEDRHPVDEPRYEDMQEAVDPETGEVLDNVGYEVVEEGATDQDGQYEVEYAPEPEPAPKPVPRPAQRPVAQKPQPPRPTSTAPRGQEAPSRPAQASAKPVARPAATQAPAAKPAAPKPAAKPAQVTKSTAVTKPRPAEVPMVANEAVPDFMRSDAGRGMENIGRDDLEIPRIKLIQGLSPELKEYDELRAGHLFHTSAGESFPDGIEVVPLYVDKRYILWNPLEAGGGILARADDGTNWVPANKSFTVKLDKKDGGHTVTWETQPTVQESGLAEWGTLNPDDPDSQPAATLMYCFVVAFAGRPDLMPAVLTFQKTSLRAGKKWLTKLKGSRAPIFGQKFMLSSVEDSAGPNRDFYNFSIVGQGFVTDQDEYNSYKEMSGQFSADGLQIKDLEGAQVDADVPNDGDEEGAQDY